MSIRQTTPTVTTVSPSAASTQALILDLFAAYRCACATSRRFTHGRISLACRGCFSRGSACSRTASLAGFAGGFFGDLRFDASSEVGKGGGVTGHFVNSENLT